VKSHPRCEAPYTRESRNWTYVVQGAVDTAIVVDYGGYQENLLDELKPRCYATMNPENNFRSPGDCRKGGSS